MLPPTDHKLPRVVDLSPTGSRRNSDVSSFISGRNKLEKMAVKFDARKKNSRITIFRVALSPGWSHTVIINGTVTPYS